MRKDNRDSHMKACHPSRVVAREGSFISEATVDSEVRDRDEAEKETSEVVSGEIGGLKAKLMELEMRKKELVTSQMKVEEDILAVKRTLQLCLN